MSSCRSGGNEREGELPRRGKRDCPGAYGACDDEGPMPPKTPKRSVILLPQKIEIPSHPPRRRKVRFTQDTQVWVSFAALPCSSSPKCNRFAGLHLGFLGSHPRRGGLWPPLPKRGAQNVGGIVNPSVSLTADSSPYTGEPLSAATGHPGVIGGGAPYTKKGGLGGYQIINSPPAPYCAG